MKAHEGGDDRHVVVTNNETKFSFMLSFVEVGDLLYAAFAFFLRVFFPSQN